MLVFCSFFLFSLSLLSQIYYLWDFYVLLDRYKYCYEFFEVSISLLKFLLIQKIMNLQLYIQLILLLMLRFTKVFKQFQFSSSKFSSPLTKGKPSINPAITPKILKNPSLNNKIIVNPPSISVHNNLNKTEKQDSQLLNIIHQTRYTKKKSQYQAELPKKCPVVTIMGHVDHGKTSLIDYLRKSNIAEKQDGGITQKIGAFSIKLKQNKVTFIDTPGHEAFINMRQRGATVTDLVVLIVSAVQGVKNQTLEVINILKKNKVPMIVAINKLDLPQANPQQVQNQLLQAGLPLQPHGGHIPIIHISAKTGQNIELLCELILQESKHYTAQQNCMAQGVVLQAYEDKEGLNSCTIIVQQGILKPGDFLVVGQQVHKIKYMKDDQGNSIDQAFPGSAVQIMGMMSIPNAGEYIYQVQHQKKGKFIIMKRKQLQQQQNKDRAANNKIEPTKFKINSRRQRKIFNHGFSSLWTTKFNEAEQIITTRIQQLQAIHERSLQQQAELQAQYEKLKKHKQYIFEYLQNQGDSNSRINIIFKFADRGIEETILAQLDKIKEKLQADSKVSLNIIRSDIGQITQNDVKDAAMINAEIITFGVGPRAEAIPLLKENKITPRTHKLIHGFMKDFQEMAMSKKKKDIKGVQKGRANIMEIFKIKGNKKSQGTKIAGALISQGKLNKNNEFYIFRNNVPISSKLQVKCIKIFKKESVEVKKNQECTFTFCQQVQFQKGDKIVAFEA